MFRNFFVIIVFFLPLNAYNQDYRICIEKSKKMVEAERKSQYNCLTNDYNLIYNRIEWKVNPAVDSISGSVTFYFKPLVPEFNLFHAHLSDKLNVDSIIYGNKPIIFTHKNNIIAAQLSKKVKYNSTDSITIFYGGKPENKYFGSFVSITHADTVPVLWTLSEPYGAMMWFPCKQTLKDKVDSLDIFVQTHKKYKVASNGKLMSEKISGTTKTTHWKHRYPIATYLIAIAVTNYAEFSDFAKVDSINTVEILNYVYPENLEKAKKQAAYTVDVLELFSKKFIPYPFYKEKYGHAQFGWGGGMEHQTMSFMANFSQGLIAHELAHQWFGNKITCASWHDIWVNEGFAVFCENLVVENLHPDNWFDWKNNQLQSILYGAKSGSVYVSDTTKISNIFNSDLTYKKGGFLLHSLRFQIGDSAFFQALRTMLNSSDLHNGFLSATDVKKYFEIAADTNLTEFFNDWYFGEGYPLYSFCWSQDKNFDVKLSVKQTQTHSAVSFFQMHLPFVINGKEKSDKISLHNTYNNQEFIFNPGYKIDKIFFDPELTIITQGNFKLDNSSCFKQEPFYIKPNPAKDIIELVVRKDINIKRLRVINNSGKEVLKQNFLKNENIIDISTFSSGIYYIEAISGKKKFIERFVKH